MTDWNKKFTEHAQRALLVAQTDAKERGHHLVQPGHIMLAILKNPKCVAVAVLRDIGVNTARLRKDCVALLHGHKSAPINGGQVQFSEETERVLGFALSEASFLRNPFVGTEHLLLGVVQEFDHLRNSPFRHFGMDFTALRQRIVQAIGHASSEASLSELREAIAIGPDQDEAIAVSKNLGIPFASFENQILKMEEGQDLENAIPETFARQHQVIPLFRDEGVLAVAVANPDNLLLLEQIQQMTGLQLQPFVATKAQIAKAIDKFYKHG